MPYIICVNQPGCLPEADPTAVATIEEAREAAFDELDRAWRSWDEDSAPATMQDAARNLPESGGTVGPLPGPAGYVIDVRLVDWGELADLSDAFPDGTIPDDPRVREESIIDAYNQN